MMDRIRRGVCCARFDARKTWINLLVVGACVAAAGVVAAAAYEPPNEQELIQQKVKHYGLQAQVQSAPAHHAVKDEPLAAVHEQVVWPTAASAPAPDVNDLFDRHYYQEDAAGTIWVRGRNFKASFNAGGVQFIPFLGSDAPQNYPVHIQPARVFSAGKAMRLDASAAPVREGDVIRFDRGQIVEVFDITTDHVEQKFVLNERPSGRGGLTFRIPVQTELARSGDSWRLRFSNDRGSVEYSRAVLVDDTGAATPLVTTFAGDEIVIEVPAAMLDEAVFPIVVDPVISVFQVSVIGATNHQHADVAYDLTTDSFRYVFEMNFSAVDGDIFTLSHTSDGVFINGTDGPVDISTDDWRGPRIANNRLAGQFLVVAQVGTGLREIWGSTILAAGSTAAAPFKISGAFGDKIRPDVGGDLAPASPTYYLVVWQQQAANLVDSEIRARRVWSDSSLQGDEIIVSSGFYDSRPAISKTNGLPPYPTQVWTIVWQRRFSPTDEDIMGAQYLWNGQVYYPPFLINGSAQNDERPTVSSPLNPAGSEDRHVLVAYERGLGNNRTIHGSAVQGPLHISHTHLNALDGAPVGQHRRTPHVDSTGKEYVLTYSERFLQSELDYDVYLSTFCWKSFTLVSNGNRHSLGITVQHEGLPRLAARNVAFGGKPRVGAAWAQSIDFGVPGVVIGAVYEATGCCPADIAPTGGDGVVGVADLLALLSQWGFCPGCAADLNNDYAVGVADLLLLLAAWGPCN